jgi:hypothetical protein
MRPRRIPGPHRAHLFLRILVVATAGGSAGRLACKRASAGIPAAWHQLLRGGLAVRCGGAHRGKTQKLLGFLRAGSGRWQHMPRRKDRDGGGMGHFTREGWLQSEAGVPKAAAHIQCRPPLLGARSLLFAWHTSCPAYTFVQRTGSVSASGLGRRRWPSAGSPFPCWGGGAGLCLGRWVGCHKQIYPLCGPL